MKMKIKFHKPTGWDWLMIGGSLLSGVACLMKSMVKDHQLTEKITSIVRKELGN